MNAANSLQWHHRRIRFSFGKAGLKGEAIFAVGLTGQMYGLVQLDAVSYFEHLPGSAKIEIWGREIVQGFV